MAKVKKTIDAFDLAEKYLSKTGMLPSVYQPVLFRGKYDNKVYYDSLASSNILPVNKPQSSYRETHIAIKKAFNNWFFSPTVINNFSKNPKANPAPPVTKKISFFEQNISAMIARWSLLQKTNSITPSRNYTNTNNILSGNIFPWLQMQNNHVQVHIGKIKSDFSCFNDARISLRIQDVLIMFRNKYDDSLFIVIIPSEFADKYTISNTASTYNKYVPSVKDNKTDRENEAQYDLDVDSEVNATYLSTPAPAPAAKSGSKGKRYATKPSLGVGALKNANYTCEVCGTKITFSRKKGGAQYMEAHHLIPMSKQGLYMNSIDHTANLICLCPTCHKKIHYGKDSEVKQMLNKLYTKRQAKLKSAGIDVDKTDITTLYSYYSLS